MGKVLISIIVPCYCQVEYLDECLQSVLDQTYSEWECIIVNDGSPDNTEDVAISWTLKDKRFKYLKKENGGLSSARNAGIEIAKGEWILPLDSDDKIANNYLKFAAEQFQKDYTIIYCDAKYFGAKSEKIILKPFDIQSLLIENMIFCTAFYKRKAWQEVSGYDANLIYGWEDWDFWLSLAKTKALLVYKIPEICFYYRIKNDSMLLSLEGEKARLMKNYIKNKHQELYLKNFGDYFQLIKENRNLRAEKIHLENKLNSKRYTLIDKILKVLKK